LVNIRFLFWNQSYKIILYPNTTDFLSSLKIILSNNRKHRGQHPNDEKLFGEKNVLNLKNGVHDLSELLSSYWLKTIFNGLTN